jgi:MEMO1 family protein
MMNARPAAVAGSCYPAAREPLCAQVDALLGAAPAEDGPTPKVLVVPHGGYDYSGAVAAKAYAALRAAEGRVRRVVLFGPAHRVRVRGLALPEAEAFETPLGAVPIDKEALAQISWVPASAFSHAKEHSLEVQLPFLMRTLGRFSLVPLVVGDASLEEVTIVLEALWGGPETLVVVSSDLSHYLPYTLARSVDAETAQRILKLGPGPLDHEQACGATPLNGLLAQARRRKLRSRLLDLRSSGDTAGGRGEVIGYGAFAFYEQEGAKGAPGGARS